VATYSFIPKDPFSLNKVELLQSGTPYFARLFELLEQAKHVIHIQFYIFNLDGTGRLVLEALVDAAKRGVKVFVVVDAYASEDINNKTLNLFTQHGINVRRFSTINYKGGLKLGRRMHHKIVWVDGEHALIGGINIADKYSGFDGKAAWLDFAVEVSGPICKNIQKVCNDILRNKWLRQAYKDFKTPDYNQNYTCESRIIQNDFFRRKLQISQTYRQAIRKSEKSVVIVASYFLPGNSLRRIIKRACDRGVKVTVILTGLSDVPFIKPAIIWLYDWMFRNNITIYEWEKSILHGKLAMIDDEWVTVGSFNLNELSDYGSLELNVEVKNKEFAATTNRLLQQIIKDGCKQITPETYRRRSLTIRFSRWFSYQLVRLILRFLFVFMQLRDDKKMSGF
jgi:cardiolipin synthase